MAATTRRIVGHSANDMSTFSSCIEAVNTREGESLLLYLYQEREVILRAIENFSAITFLFSSVEQDAKKSVLYKSVVQFKLQQDGFGLPNVVGQLPAYEVLDNESFRHVFLSSKRLLAYYAGDISNSATLLEGLTSETKKRIAYQQLRDLCFVTITSREELDQIRQILPEVCHEDWRQARFNTAFAYTVSAKSIVNIVKTQPDLAPLLGETQLNVIAGYGPFSAVSHFRDGSDRCFSNDTLDLLVALSLLTEGQQEQFLTMLSRQKNPGEGKHYPNKVNRYYYEKATVSDALRLKLIFLKDITKPQLQIQALMRFALCCPKLEDLLEIMPLSCLSPSNGQEVVRLAKHLELWRNKEVYRRWDDKKHSYCIINCSALTMLSDAVQPTFQARPLGKVSLDGMATLKLAVLYFYSDIVSQAGNSDDAKAATFTSYLSAAIKADFGSQKPLRLTEFVSVLAMPMLSLITDLSLLCDIYQLMSAEQQ
jgi:hypothetical protein